MRFEQEKKEEKEKKTAAPAPVRAVSAHCRPYLGAYVLPFLSNNGYKATDLR